MGWDIKGKPFWLMSFYYFFVQPQLKGHFFAQNKQCKVVCDLALAFNANSIALKSSKILAKVQYNLQFSVIIRPITCFSYLINQPFCSKDFIRSYEITGDWSIWINFWMHEFWVLYSGYNRHFTPTYLIWKILIKY